MAGKKGRELQRDEARGGHWRHLGTNAKLRDRVKEYRTKGSHATALINDALTMEYESWFRIQNAPDRQFTVRIECETQWLM